MNLIHAFMMHRRVRLGCCLLQTNNGADVSIIILDTLGGAIDDGMKEFVVEHLMKVPQFIMGLRQHSKLEEYLGLEDDAESVKNLSGAELTRRFIDFSIGRSRY